MEPEMMITDFGKAERPPIMHWGWQALHRFIRQHGHPPRPRHQVGTSGTLGTSRGLVDMGNIEGIGDNGGH